MSTHPDFRVDIFQNEYLSEGAREVNAIVTVTASGEVTSTGATADAAEVIIVDCSGSMGYPRGKLMAAKQATAAAIDAQILEHWMVRFEIAQRLKHRRGPDRANLPSVYNVA